MIRVKAAFFSLTPPAPPDDDGSYLRWHLLDHMVEQYQLPGVQYAQGDLQYTTVVYLDGDPLATTRSLVPVLQERWRSGAVRPGFAGPLRTMIEWEAWR